MSANPVIARLLMWCSLLAFAGVLWLVLQWTAPLPGQDLPAGPDARKEALAEDAGPGRPTSLVTDIRKVTRVCVDDFDGGENARQLRAMLIDQLHRLKLFVVTENPESADAFVRGFAEDVVFVEQFSRDENVGGRSGGSIAVGALTRNRRAIAANAAVNESVRERSSDRRHEAALTVRIVNIDGDVLWSGSAESRGGKYQSAASDVSTKIAQDLERFLTKPASRVEPKDSSN
jgi:hypothetical protein